MAMYGYPAHKDPRNICTVSRATAGECPEPGRLRSGSLSGLRNALMAVLRESALHRLSELWLAAEIRQRQSAMQRWHHAARKTSSALQHQRAALQAEADGDVLRGEHGKEAAELRRRWRQQREALLAKIGSYRDQHVAVPEEDLVHLQELDALHRQQMARLDDGHAGAHQDHDAYHSKVQGKCLTAMKVLGAMGALEAKHSRDLRPSSSSLGNGMPRSDSAGVCFLQWAWDPALSAG
ncbi:unnamed protein product [Polarella glacialis]|uniref:Uncharacterized protein n=1 Tax=Polarella glacialis TaxID=89957 RepID=A0A813H982_POLGL|nr:unnamed protein product [Polarella glacialis]